MANEEIKPKEEEQKPPEGGAEQKPKEPNQNPSDELQKKNKELEEQIKERDAKLAELQTERATIEARNKEITAQKLRETTDAELQSRINRVIENTSIDPETAKLELATLLKEQRERTAQETEQRVLSKIDQRTAGEKFFSMVKTANPNFSDRVAHQVLSLANDYATTGKYKSAEDAITAATQTVQKELDDYATKKNAVPKLPDGARAESGAGNNLPPPPVVPKEVSPLEEIEAFNEARLKKQI